MKSKEGWKWYGFAGHCSVGSKCQYHLSTNINNKYLISTIGKYINSSGVLEKINTTSLFETNVFEIDGDDENGDPNVLAWNEIDSNKYDISIEAEKGHYKMCEKYHDLSL